MPLARYVVIALDGRQHKPGCNPSIDNGSTSRPASGSSVQAQGLRVGPTTLFFSAAARCPYRSYLVRRPTARRPVGDFGGFLGEVHLYFCGCEVDVPLLR